MAVDLTPRFRRLNSQTRSFREAIQHGFSGPFGATQLWYNIIQALRTQVEVRRCRRHLRVHAGCFTGSDAVDAVLSYLMQNVVFCTSEVSRLKAARLCQALMEAKVFEPVGTKLFRREKEVTFEDSGCSLYRFLEDKGFPNAARRERNSDAENTPSQEEGVRKKSSRLQDPKLILNPLVVGPSDRRVERLLRMINLQPNLSQGLNRSSTFLSKAVVEEVWKQQTLLQLLQVVEVPVLDCILTSPERVHLRACRTSAAAQDLVISNTCLERELSDVLNLNKLDGWLSAAADCLELFPDQLIVFAGEQLSQNGDVGKVQEAIKASQLYLRLLETSVKEELRRLLAFMATAAHPESCPLQKQVDNRTLICRTFQKAIIPSHELTRCQSENLLMFLMDNSTEIFKTPSSLVEAVRKVLRITQQGKDPDSITTFTFCQQVSPEEYEDQREAATLESLRKLLGEISSSRTLSVKERRRLLKEFEKHHPVVFLQHLSSTF
ncbi:DEP domain-containing protein 7 [Takifugu flavidus]|uniref:DEP domain-containing protein 7 n=1 Tax=Takifugu flavidus TaxID=433684 RepID=A0A5C6NDY6_9TELE|nr:DEP domain-containing protein 7 [Takifugu flavidus]